MALCWKRLTGDIVGGAISRRETYRLELLCPNEAQFQARFMNVPSFSSCMACRN